MGSPRTPETPLADDLLLDSICERYEAALRAGLMPTPDSFLAEAPTTLRTKLGEEFAKLREAHERASTPTRIDEKTLGPYTLVQLLGEGGMGEVWVARQEQPVRRSVALKLVRAGLDSRATLARFEQERQTLANLEHPNIARVLDAGTTALGRPYFVMELIDGKRLNDYCDAAKLNVRARLRLFQDLCRAVQHAHQKGVIHRDLKPGNILVAEVDGQPIVKVIDFGVAKVLGEGGIDQLIATQAGIVVGTWEYMAPEQAGTAASDIDTRADVYSLGVILYELVTGLRPFDSQRLRTVPVDEAIRILREEDPPRPSTRVSQATNTLAKADPSALSLLRGDLDWVVMKCLEKDRNRRYESVASLAREVERCLANETVEARPPSLRYRIGKFVRRNRIVVGVCLVIALAAFSGSASALWGYFQAKAAAAETMQALKEVSFANDTIFDVFADFDIRRVKQGADPVEYVLAERLVKASQQLTPETIRDPATCVRLQNRMGLTLLSLDRPQDAIPLFQSALTTSIATHGDDHSETLETKSNLAEAFRKAGQSTEALTLYEQVHAKTLELHGSDHVKSVNAMSNLAAGNLAVGSSKAALPLYEQVLTWRTANLGESDPDTLVSMNNLAACYVANGERLKAVPQYERVLAMRTAMLGANHADTLLSLNNLASTYMQIGRIEDGLPLLEKAVTLHREKFGPDHQQTLACMGNLAAGYRSKGRLSDAVTLYEQTLTLKQSRLGRAHPETLLGMNNLANAYRASKQLDKAIPLFEETLALQEERLSRDHPDTLLTMNNLAYSYHENNQVGKAVPVYERALTGMRGRYGFNHPETTSCIGNLAIAYVDAGVGEKAVPLFAEFVAIKKTNPNPNQLSFAATLTQIGIYLLKARQFAAAEPHLRESLAIREKLASSKWGTDYGRSLVGQSLLGQRRYTEAESYLVTGYEGLLKHRNAIPGGSANVVFETGRCLLDLYETTKEKDKARVLRNGIPHEIAPSPQIAKE